GPQSPVFAFPPANGGETIPNYVETPEFGAEVSPEGPSPLGLTFYRNSVLRVGTTPIAEDFLAQTGNIVFVTGNWFAALSTNDGGIWTYINPYADYPSFCCDQQVIADRGRDIILWFRQGTYNPITKQGDFKLSVIRTGRIGATFCTYTVSPKDVNGALTDDWFDYPRLAFTDNYLYIS